MPSKDKERFELSAAEKRELDGCPKLNDLPDGQLISVTARQISLMSCVPMGSVGFFISEGQLTAAIPRSMVFRVSDLRQFCARHRVKAAMRLLQAANTERDTTLNAAADALVDAVIAANPGKYSVKTKK